MKKVHKSPLPFVKLYMSRMASSSLWEEPPTTRLLFIWFLGVADIDGYVLPHTATNIARLANMPLDEVTKGLERLEGPDRHSRSKAHEGRRLLRQEDGGWLIVNAAQYREMRTWKQVADAERQNKSRKARKARPLSKKAQEVKAFDTVTGNVGPDSVYKEHDDFPF